MKKFILCLVLLCTILLSGCTVWSDRIYVVCRVVGDEVYVYNENGFYRYVNKRVVPVPTADLQPMPKLHLAIPSEIDFVLEKEMPSVYMGTLEDSLKYLSAVLQTYSAEYQILSCDWKSYEAYIRCADFDMRIVYSSDNKVRVYANDMDGLPIVPPLLD